jgi:hypothetical protein
VPNVSKTIATGCLLAIAVPPAGVGHQPSRARRCGQAVCRMMVPSVVEEDITSLPHRRRMTILDACRPP